MDIPTYDYTEHTRSSKTYRQEPQDVFIVEGILVLEDKRLRDLMDIKIFVDTDDDVRIIRRIKRDMEERGRSLDSVIDQYLGVVKPMVSSVLSNQPSVMLISSFLRESAIQWLLTC